eukprot:705116-Hanusia_phi.AAC.1
MGSSREDGGLHRRVGLVHEGRRGRAGTGNRRLRANDEKKKEILKHEGPKTVSVSPHSPAKRGW